MLTSKSSKSNQHCPLSIWSCYPVTVYKNKRSHGGVPHWFVKTQWWLSFSCTLSFITIFTLIRPTFSKLDMTATVFFFKTSNSDKQTLHLNLLTASVFGIYFTTSCWPSDIMQDFGTRKLHPSFYTVKIITKLMRCTPPRPSPHPIHTLYCPLSMVKRTIAEGLFPAPRSWPDYADSAQ